MTVIAFSRTRFTPQDLEEFRAIAEPRLADGRWASCTRRSDPASDRIEIRLPGTQDSSFTFLRDKTGTYALLYHDASGTHRVSSGETVRACLYLWRRVRRTAAAAPAATRAPVTVAAGGRRPGTVVQLRR